MRRRKCRVWWPEQLLSCKPNSALLLFGWFVPSSCTSIDVVVATAAPLDQILLMRSQADLQEILRYANGKMPTMLQDCSMFSMLGFLFDYHYECQKMMDNQKNDLDCDSFTQTSQSFQMDFTASKANNYGRLRPQHDQEIFGNAASTVDCGRWQCGCHKLDRFVEQYRQYSINNGNWVQLSSSSKGFLCKKIGSIPNLHHMHCNGDLLSTHDAHVIIYEPPTFGTHHFSLSSWNSSEHAKTPFKRPKWVDELYQKQPFSDLDIVFLALNSASAAKTFFEGSLVPRSSFQQFPIISMLVAVAWHSIAMFVASFFTFFYVILHVCHGFLGNASLSSICMLLEKVFSHTWKNVHIRSCQLLYLPIFLQGSGSRLKSSVEYAHRAALRHHSIWSSIFIDVLLGNVVGWALLLYREAVYFWILHLVSNVTNNLLRSGCVWLMGVPAGFKLNTELARVLGMLSLNAIQIWSTLWFFIGFLFRHFIEGLAMSGIVLGVTIPAALCIDMLNLATLHLSTLHWLISLLYSQQIQALASLWRLFRGLKWNPLRQRLDSYDYTVEQHVVGSLIFTPILLLLPTSSVFYIFFTIMNATTSFICILIEVAISVLHATPYAEIFLWMVRPRRFPSGIWFEIILGQNSNMPAPKLSFSNEDYSPSAQERMAEKNDKKGPGEMVSVLRSNFATLGQVILPHHRNAFRGVSLSSAASSAYGVLSGQRIPSSLGTGFPSTMPWFSLSFKQYWRLCCDSVLAVRSDP